MCNLQEEDCARLIVNTQQPRAKCDQARMNTQIGQYAAGDEAVLTVPASRIFLFLELVSVI